MYERLGVGGMATVHRAKERGIEGFERIVALKRLLPHLAEDEMFVRSFVREAKLAALLNHANVVQLYELGRVGPEYFISMEYIQGRDIRKILRQARKVTGPPPIEVIVALLTQTCDALDYAHTRRDEHGEPLGLIHRDVSPSNLIINESGHVKVIDFGIAKAKSQQLRTQTGRIKGKMAYMAPEAIKGLELDARSDLFSAGVLAHELLTARPLFASKNDYQTLQRVQNAELIPPSKYNADCPPELDAIVLKALARDRDTRWQSAEEMRDALVEVKVRHKLASNARTVTEWMEWAFALEAPMGRGSGSVQIPTGMSRTGATSSTHSVSGPPPLETDDEILEMSWEGRSEVGPVLLDEVPDVSDRASAHFVASAQTPSKGVPTLSDGVVAAAAEASKSGGTLIAYVPPPPNQEITPTDWANGTRPPLFGESVSEAVPQRIDDKDDKSTSDGIPAASTELSGEGVGKDSEMHVAATARPTTSAPVLAKARPTTSAPVLAKAPPTAAAPALTSIPARKPRASTQFGAAIIEREKGPTTKIIAAVAAVLLIGVGGYLATRGGGGAKKVATSGTKATTPATAPGGAVTRSKRAQLRFVVEPKDATIVVDGHGEHTGTGKKIKLKAGSYNVVVKHDGYKSWNATIDVEANENQTVRVALAPEGSDETSEGTPVKDARKATHSARRDRERRRRRRTRITTPTDDVDDDSGDEMDDDLKVKVGETTSLTPNIIKPTLAPTPTAPKSTGPAIVLVHKVKKVSGSFPALRSLKGEDLPGRISVKLCISTSGTVNTVKVITSVPLRMKRTLRASLSSWRYRPYKSGGSARAACFVHSFKLKRTANGPAGG